MRKLVLMACLFTSATMACDLKVESAWIREAPSTATSLAGYAVLTNTGSKNLSVVGASAPGFAKVEMHETLMDHGIAKMRAIEKLEIAAKAKVEFMPSGKHFMLIGPKSALRVGEMVPVNLKDSSGCVTLVQFKVGAPTAKPAESMDHSKMNHSEMNHSEMSHSMHH